LGDPAGDRDPFNLIVLSNQPDHYLHPDVASLGGSLLSVFGRDPCIPSLYPTAIAAIHHAADKYGTIPTTFEQAG